MACRDSIACIRETIMSMTAGLISDEKELKKIYRLRYKVYCLELGFENPDKHEDETITDQYDDKALHFGVKDDIQKIVGAASLILYCPEGFPTERYCELNIDRNELPRESMGEISQLVIRRDYRRRAEDKYIYGPDEERRSIGSFDFVSGYADSGTHFRRAEDRHRYRGVRRTNTSFSERRSRHEVIINLYKAIYLESKKRGLTHWYAVMTKGIVLLLGKFGFKFHAIGDPVDYHGIRTPYLGEIQEIEQEMSEKNPGLYGEFTRNL